MKKNQILLCLIAILMFQAPCMAMEPADSSSDLSPEILHYFVAATLQTIFPTDFASNSSIYQYASVQFSPDSQILSAIGNNGPDYNTLRINSWQAGNESFQNDTNINSFKLNGTIPEKPNTPPDMPKIITESTLAFSNKGLLLAAGQPDKTIAIFDLSNSGRTVLPNNLLSSALAYTPDDSKLISGSFDESSTINVWDVAKKELIKAIPATESRVNYIVCAPDGSKFVTGFKNGAVTVWNLTTYDPVTTFADHTAAVKTLTFNPNGSELAVGFADGTLELINMQTNNIDTLVPPQPIDMTNKLKQLALAVIALGYNPPKAELISISGKPTIKIWNLNTKTCNTTIELFYNVAFRAAISSDCTKFAISSFFEFDEVDAYDLKLARELVNRQLTPGQMDVLKKIATPQLIAQLQQYAKNDDPHFKFKDLGISIIMTFSTLPETDQRTLKEMGFKFMNQN